MAYRPTGGAPFSGLLRTDQARAGEQQDDRECGGDDADRGQATIEHVQHQGDGKPVWSMYQRPLKIQM